MISFYCFTSQTHAHTLMHLANHTAGGKYCATTKTTKVSITALANSCCVTVDMLWQLLTWLKFCSFSTGRQIYTYSYSYRSFNPCARILVCPSVRCVGVRASYEYFKATHSHIKYHTQAVTRFH